MLFSLFILLVAGCVLFIIFLYSFFSIVDIINKKQTISLSYATVVCLIFPVLSYLLIDLSIRGTYLFFKEGKKTQKTYKVCGVIIASWLIISIPVLLGLSFYLTSNGYQKCPPKNLFTSYYTVDASLCSDPFYDERIGSK
ncbi:hypothetical protein CKG00_01670 [Morganella morganii]|uniref:DUF1240 domain-containing protein n=1 Tax=Morganella morganii TaxID=582 RepID=A0A433ZSY9_MORMO|nr:hypothetical protein CKG00_01670 [Morganella morganii]